MTVAQWALGIYLAVSALYFLWTYDRAFKTYRGRAVTQEIVNENDLFSARGTVGFMIVMFAIMSLAWPFFLPRSVYRRVTGRSEKW